MSIITLTTDFGTKDQYVGSLRGVIHSINPKAVIADITHEIPSFDIAQAAYIVGTTFHLYPRGTIHLAVVDPGVGSSRLPIVIQTKNYFFVGPDNGIFSMVPLREEILSIHKLTNRKYFRSEISNTFHGRDIFSPTAAHLSRGISPSRMGSKLKRFKTLNLFDLKISGGRIEGKIIAIDKFGNAVTNLNREMFYKKVGRKKFIFEMGSKKLSHLSRAYSDVPPGKPLLLFGSSDLMEVACHQASMVAKWKIRPGQRWSLIW